MGKAQIGELGGRGQGGMALGSLPSALGLLLGPQFLTSSGFPQHQNAAPRTSSLHTLQAPW